MKYRLDSANERLDSVEVKYSKILQHAFQIRTACDYSDFFIVSKSDAVEQYNNAKDMISTITEFLESEYKSIGA